jgi:acyl dehydratase
VSETLPELTYEVTATTVVLGALASRDWRPMHHDHDFAVNRNGTRDIFMNTPNLAAWFERYITDWTGPKGRLGRITFRIRDSIFPGNTMRFSGIVTDRDVDETGCSWVSLEIELHADDRLATTGTARVAVPADETDNPWARTADNWRP